MNVLSEIKELFKVESPEFSERIYIVELAFDIPASFIPREQDVINILQQLPKRDIMKIVFAVDNGDEIRVQSNTDFPTQEYQKIWNDTDRESQINIQIEIQKTVENDTFSVYSFDSFSSDLLSLSTTEFLAVFSKLLHEREHLSFELFDRKCFFATETMVFSDKLSSIRCNQCSRLDKLAKCDEVSNFQDKYNYNLLPDDFAVKVDCKENPLSGLFERICATLSLAYISTSAVLAENNMLGVQIVGQRTVEHRHSINSKNVNQEFYKIYSWIYTDGNPVDKALIARNIISLHCQFSALSDMDNKTLSSILSNYNIYLRENVSQYIELKNKLAEFICDVVTKTGEHATALLHNLKNNLFAIFGFLFTVILANIVSDQPLENIFTRDIVLILEIVVAGSLIYLIICHAETQYKLKKTIESYDLLKKNYGSLLSELELREAFDRDEFLAKTVKPVRRGIWGYTVIWFVILVCFFLLLESISDSPTICSQISYFVASRLYPGWSVVTKQIWT